MARTGPAAAGPAVAPARRLRAALLSLAVATAAAPAAQTGPPRPGSAVPETRLVPAGPFIQGSSREAREAAYRLDEAAYGHRITREQGWYENEPARHEAALAAYEITANLVTNRQYAVFVRATGHRAPGVTERQWKRYGLIHPYARTRRFSWPGSQPPAGRESHPVVLVSRGDARAYADWLSERTGRHWRLPSEAEWEKAARGTDGRRFPWGDAFDPRRLNSHDAGPFDTLPVARYPEGRSPVGMWDAAGQVFEWTRTPAGRGRAIVKGGGSWDDRGCGICRAAARHSRPVELKHILIGFRLVAPPRPGPAPARGGP